MREGMERSIGKTPIPKSKGRRTKPSSSSAMMETSPDGNLTLQLDHVSLLSASRFQKLLEAEGEDLPSLTIDEEGGVDKDCILSQDFFCTPDYITPEISIAFEVNRENIACPKSPEKSVRSKRHRKEGSLCNFLSVDHQGNPQDSKLDMSAIGSDELGESKPTKNGSQKKKNYVSQSAVALRCRVMPPPCIRNPYLNSDSSTDVDLFSNRRSRFTDYSPIVGGDGLSRYRTDFHEIEQIGCGNFSHVFKVLKRIDGCMYAVKRSIRQLRHDNERRQALMEVQALAALGSHENIVGYFSSWFENEQLYIQMELCDGCLSTSRGCIPRGIEILDMLYQIAKALRFMHEHGIAHLDVKPENIYMKNGVYKLGDLGCATLIDRSLPIEEGDARYMPQEILNEMYEYLDKVDIFSLGAATYELVKGSPLPDSGPQFCNLREGKIALLPGVPMQLQILLKAMMDPNPKKRPPAKKILEDPIFEKARRTSSQKLSHYSHA